MLKNEEEFNNFMHKVTEVNGIVKKLSSNDKEQNKMGMKEADIYLNDSSERVLEKIDNEDIELKITTNKTVINPVKDEKPSNPDEMDPETFMKEIEKDAKQRSEDKKIRREQSDTFKTRGNKAFKRQEYEKAVICYTKAIELIKDSCILYLNRALSYIELQLYDKAESDCQWALKLNENSMKAWTYLAKIYFEKNDINKCNEYLKEAIDRHPEAKEAIQIYVTDLDGKNYDRRSQ